MQSALKWCSSICAIALFISGCASKPVRTKLPPLVIPKKIVDKDAIKPPGSLYNGYDNLFSDAKAYRVGDILMINVFENLSGSGSTDTKASRKHSMGLNIPSPTFMDKKVANKNTIFGFDQSSKNTFQGKGGTKRSAKLIAKISARVVKVYANGNLFIVGKKYVKINEDTQVLKISGIVKPVDINPDNTIDSSKIADMYVEYNGEGFMASTQQPGWLANFLMKIWPF